MRSEGLTNFEGCVGSIGSSRVGEILKGGSELSRWNVRAVRGLPELFLEKENGTTVQTT
jgi:hypothetical protein